MKTFIALFRGINVGGRNKLPMKDLKPLLEQQDCQNVITYIQTGNVIFQRDNAPDNLSNLVETHFGFKPDVMILTKDDFLQAVANNPFTTYAGKEVHFYFCKALPSPNFDKIDAIKATSENYRIIEHVFYLHASEGIGRSKLVTNVEKCLNVAATGRNLNTVSKLVTLLDIEKSPKI
ncbi:DUF1697 domain-containing protein [Leucothrix arctica]|uniref:DUF1697 domain-containing protein n=1 Tax=Leucothrix arctica TaxID=1481894 RepID=A0A317CM88_9GAMM|nr:DUF1697 domain-containing protein [Leucothrix arctica]PWQ99725.1 hypothetical protein DKT75_00135 [Leucothrix arctica]